MRRKANKKSQTLSPLSKIVVNELSVSAHLNICNMTLTLYSFLSILYSWVVCRINDLNDVYDHQTLVVRNDNETRSKKKEHVAKTVCHIT